jgi:hypothetical protein
MRWSEASLLVAIAVCATVAAIFAGFDQLLAVYTGVLGWGASRTVTKS